jgi:uncharacterized protein YecT (DUF1311 family)
MISRFNTAFSAVLMGALQLALSFAAERSYAQNRKPTAREIAAIRDCATRNRDNLDQGERQCLFSLVADPCINKPSGDANNPTEADCYRMEDSIWDGLLNENYKGLLDTLDDGQTAKAHAMQRAWMAYRDTTRQFYDDKIQGSMATAMHAACVARESARRAMLLKFFTGL